MAYRHDGNCPIQLLQNIVKLTASLRIDAGHSLIQKENLRARDQGSGNEHALQLTAGELTDPSAPAPPQPHLLQYLLRGYSVLPCMPRPTPTAPQTTHQDNIEYGDRKFLVDMDVLRHIADSVRHPGRGLAKNGDRSPSWIEQTKHQLEHGRFTAAVGTDNNQEIILRHTQVHLPENRLPVKGKPHVFHLDYGLRHQFPFIARPLRIFGLLRADFPPSSLSEDRYKQSARQSPGPTTRRFSRRIAAEQISL